jgi:galactokinase
VTQASPARQATSLFQDRFGSGPSVLVSAPGRVNLLGEHTDYNGGPVLPLALERRTVVAAGPGEGWGAVSLIDGVVVPLDPERIDPDHWSGYLAGVIRVMRRRGVAVPGARLAIASTVPVGAGLSSSAALTVSATRALSGLAGVRATSEQLIDTAYQAEHDEVGVACGRMDQTIVTLGHRGHALLYETGAETVTHVPFPGKVWLFETGVAHRLAGGHLNQRRRECEEALTLVHEQGVAAPTLADVPAEELHRLVRALPVPWRHRLRHVVTETTRTRLAAQALATRDLATMGRLMVEGHASLQNDYQSTCPEADLLVESLVRHGALGARLTGAGWGGAVLALLPPGKEAIIVAEAQDDFRKAFGRLPEVWATRASEGVRSEK